MSGFGAPKGNEFDIAQIPSAVLGTSTSILSKELIQKLGSELNIYTKQVAEELGFSPTLALSDGLAIWCCSPGSTVFVLVCILNNIGRLDCIKWILTDIEMRTMHLYVKVEEAAKDGLCLSSPKYHQVTTNSEFSLIQALENILGGDLTHYEIFGPGHWVTWSTKAEELKGQMLTLRYHPSPVAQTCEDLYGHATSNTEVKRPVSMCPNIPAFIVSKPENGMSPQLADPTRIENLKFRAQPVSTSSSVSDSNNATAENSLEKGVDVAMAESMMPEGPTKTFDELTLDTCDRQFTLDSATHMKIPVSGRSTPKEMEVNNANPDKVIVSQDSDFEHKKENTNAFDILNNVPFLSALQQGFCVSMNSSNNVDIATHHETSVKQIEGEECEQNDLNCTPMTFHARSFHPHSWKSDTQIKSYECQIQVSSSGVSSKILSEVDGEEKMDQNIDGEEDYKTNPAKKVEIGSLALSLQAKLLDKCHENKMSASSFKSNTQKIVLPASLTSMEDYVSHDCIQSIVNHPRKDRSDTDRPSPCGSPNQVRTPPQKRHRSGPLPSSHPNVSTHQQPFLQPQDQHFTQLQKQEDLEHQQQTILLTQNSAISSVGQHPQWQQFSPLHHNNQQNTPILVHDTQNHEHQYQNIQYIVPQSQPDLNQQQLQSQPPHYQRQPQQTNTQPSLICHTPPPSLTEGNQAKNQFNSSSKPAMLMQSNLRPSDKDSEINNCGNGIFFSQQKPVLGNAQFLDVTNQNQKPVNKNDYMVMNKPSMMVTSDNNGQTFRQEIQLTPPTAQSSTQEPVQMTLKHDGSIQVVSQSNHFRHVEGAVGGAEVGMTGKCQQGAPDIRQDFRAVSMPFYPAPLPHVRAPNIRMRSIGPNIHPQMSPGVQMRRVDMENTVAVEEDQRYSYIDADQVVRRSGSNNQSQRSGDHVIPSPVRRRESLEVELAQLPGWSPHENGDTIQQTMEKYRKHDGCYIVWKSRRHNKFVITVSHMNELIYLRVEQAKTDTNQTVYYLFQGGFSSESLKELVEYYSQNGLRVPVQSAGRQKVYNEHISLRYPLRVCVDSQRNRQTTISK